MNPAYRTLGFALAMLALPAMGAWEELRRNDQVRLSIDPKSIKRKGDTVSFVYLVDFRQTQGDYKTVEYRSLVTKAHIRCKARMMVTVESEAYPGNEAKGVALGVMKPRGKDAEFAKLEAGSSDEDLHKRVCSPAPAAAASDKAAPKK